MEKTIEYIANNHENKEIKKLAKKISSAEDCFYYPETYSWYENEDEEE